MLIWNHVLKTHLTCVSVMNENNVVKFPAMKQQHKWLWQMLQ